MYDDAPTMLIIDGKGPDQYRVKLPLRTVEIITKQIDRSELSEFGHDVLRWALPEFVDPETYQRAVKTRAEQLDIRPLAPIAGPTGILSGQERRFAGDHTLPRDRYYTISQPDGSDGGTLLKELKAYYDPIQSGPINFFEIDLRETETIQRLGELGVKIPKASRAIIFNLVGTNDEPHPLASAYGLSTPLKVMFPVRVKKKRIRKVVDLRDPTAADAFAREMTSLKGPRQIPVFPKKPKLNSFTQLLPTILGQELGGNMFCKIAGEALRDSGCNGLIYPSARSDSSVSVVEGTVTEALGWCFVDYRRAPKRIRGLGFVDYRDTWAQYIAKGGGVGLRDNGPWVYYPEIRIRSIFNGPEAGSWSVMGIEARREFELSRRSEEISR